MTTFKWTLIAVARDSENTPLLKLTYRSEIKKRVLCYYVDGSSEPRETTERVEKIEYLDHPNEDVCAFFINLGILP